MGLRKNCNGNPKEITNNKSGFKWIHKVVTHENFEMDLSEIKEIDYVYDSNTNTMNDELINKINFTAGKSLKALYDAYRRVCEKEYVPTK